MPFFQVDDQLHANRKARALAERVLSGDIRGFAALGFWTACGSQAQASGTDGVVSIADAVRVALDSAVARELAGLLVEVGLWHGHGHVCPRCAQPPAGGFIFHDWFALGYDTGAATRTRSAKAKELKDRALIEGVWSRDATEWDAKGQPSAAPCRYCGVRCVRSVRRVAKGGWQVDHVDPMVAAGAQNIVIACRECNQRKGQRTPEQAGMVLRPAPRRSRAHTAPQDAPVGVPDGVSQVSGPVGASSAAVIDSGAVRASSTTPVGIDSGGSPRAGLHTGADDEAHPVTRAGLAAVGDDSPQGRPGVEASGIDSEDARGWSTTSVGIDSGDVRVSSTTPVGIDSGGSPRAGLHTDADDEARASSRAGLHTDVGDDPRPVARAGLPDDPPLPAAPEPVEAAPEHPSVTRHHYSHMRTKPQVRTQMCGGVPARASRARVGLAGSGWGEGLGEGPGQPQGQPPGEGRVRRRHRRRGGVPPGGGEPGDGLGVQIADPPEVPPGWDAGAVPRGVVPGRWGSPWRGWTGRRSEVEETDCETHGLPWPCSRCEQEFESEVDRGEVG